MLLNTHDYGREARRRLPRFVYEYLDGGAEDEQCLRRNGEDLARLQLLPTCLRDTRSIDTTIEVFGQRWGAPFGLAPIGLCGLGHHAVAAGSHQAAHPFHRFQHSPRSAA